MWLSPARCLRVRQRSTSDRVAEFQNQCHCRLACAWLQFPRSSIKYGLIFVSNLIDKEMRQEDEMRR